MATRRTRLKGRRTPQSTGGKQVSRGTATTRARKNNAGTPTGHSRVAKRVAKKASPRQTAKVNVKPEQKTPTRTRKTKAVAGTSGKSPGKDEYEFNETDDFITENSLLSPSFSASSSKTPKNGPMTNVKSSKSVLTNQQKGIQKKAQNQHAGPQESKKKTSTPLSNQATKGQPGKPRERRQRYLQISVPKLDLDISVTPILPISADQSLTTRTSPRQKARKGSGTKSVSFEEDVKESFPVQTPAGKINNKTQRQLAVAKNLSSISDTGSFKEPAPVLSSVVATAASVEPRRIDRKRKSSEFTNSEDSKEASIPAKRMKTDIPKTKQPVVTGPPHKASSLSPKSKPIKKQAPTSSSGSSSKQTTENGPSHKLSSLSPKSKPTKKQAPTSSSGSSGKQTKEKEPSHKASSLPPKSKPTKKQAPISSPGSSGKQTRKRLKPVTSTPALFAEDEQLELEDEQVGQSPPVYDSGISLGDDVSMSEDRGSAETTPLPGFMEDEPMHDSMDHLGSSPLSAPATASKSPSKEDSVYKSAAKSYKSGKTKREKGRYSSSKVDAWADAVNQSLQDVESFELVVE